MTSKSVSLQTASRSARSVDSPAIGVTCNDVDRKSVALCVKTVEDFVQRRSQAKATSSPRSFKTNEAAVEDPSGAALGHSTASPTDKCDGAGSGRMLERDKCRGALTRIGGKSRRLADATIGPKPVAPLRVCGLAARRSQASRGPHASQLLRNARREKTRRALFATVQPFVCVGDQETRGFALVTATNHSEASS